MGSPIWVLYGVNMGLNVVNPYGYIILEWAHPHGCSRKVILATIPSLNSAWFVEDDQPIFLGNLLQVLHVMTYLQICDSLQMFLTWNNSAMRYAFAYVSHKYQRNFKLKLMTSLSGAVRQHSRTGQATQDEVKKSGVSYHFNARDMKRGRKRRSNGQQVLQDELESDQDESEL